MTEARPPAGWVGRARITVVRRLPSKRNRVVLAVLEGEGLRVEAVVKNHPDTPSARLEEERLLGLHREGLRVPRPFGTVENTLFLEFVRGRLLVDLVSMGEDAGWCGGLAEWFSALHIPLVDGCRLKGDVNLRNFILAPDGICGLDFEESPLGDRATDIGRTCAFILTTRPAFAPGREALCRNLVDEYRKLACINAAAVEHECREELEAMARRRPDERRAIEAHLARRRS